MINQKRLVSTFLNLVNIDSPSGEEKNIIDHVKKILLRLGGDVEQDNYGNIICKFKGIGTPFLLNAHLDTVEPGRGIRPQIKGDIITSDGTTILGGDDKAGVAVILETLKSVVEDKKSTVPVEVVFTIREEDGLLGAVNLEYKKIKAKIGVTLDAVSSVENITTSAPGYTRIDITVTGISAHAGFDPENGLSAIKIACEIVSKLELGRIDHETTANIGIIEGGSARNAVPEIAHFKAEIRSINLEKLEKHTLHFEKIINSVLSKYPDAKLTQDIHTEFDPYSFGEAHSAIKRVVNVQKSMKLKPDLKPSGGGADVNIFHKKGLEIVCIGAGYHNPHTTREYVVISEMLQAAMVCEKLVTYKNS